MSFCPKCRSEYINGRKECADCGTLLVESLEEYDAMQEEKRKELLAEEEERIELSEEVAGDAEESLEQGEEKQPKKIQQFVSQRQRYEDYKGSGWTFTMLAILGLLFVLANQMGVLSIFSYRGPAAVVQYTVLYGILLLFLGIGIHSFLSLSKIKEGIAKEEEQMRQVKEFVELNLRRDVVDGFSKEQSDAAMDEAEIYLVRTSAMEKAITEAFPDLDQGFVVELVDEQYNKIYGED